MNDSESFLSSPEQDLQSVIVPFNGGQPPPADTNHSGQPETNHNDLTQQPVAVPPPFSGAYSECRKKSLSCIREETRSSAFVKLLVEDETSLGIVVAGGIDRNLAVLVSSLVPDGLAYRSDVLEPRDRILSVNGSSTVGLKQDEIACLLKPQPHSVVTLEIEYEVPEPAQNLTPNVAKCTKIVVQREGKESFGIVLRGGICAERSIYRPLIVTHIRPGSAADREGRLKPGDRILEINDVDTTKMALSDAIDLLNESSSSAALLVEYNVSVIEAVQNATSPLLVEIDRPFCSSLGIDLVSLPSREGSVIVINSVIAASIADRCGALHVGDQILSINDVLLDSASVAEATRQLQCDVGERLVLEIMPRCRNKLRPLPTQTPSSHSSAAVSSIDRYASIGCLSNHSGISFDSMATQVGSAVATTIESFYQPQRHHNHYPSAAAAAANAAITNAGKHCPTRTKQEAVATVVSLLDGIQPSRNDHASHVDVTDVVLVNDNDDSQFGIVIDSTEYSTQGFIKPPIITYLEPGGIAERSGLLQEGDRVLAINGWSLRRRTVQDINDMILLSRGRLTLRIEFDVADPVTTNSSIYLVKMAKRGTGIGISVSCPKNRQVGQPIVISDVKKGSVAHRTGTISPGDYLLAIGDTWLDDYTLEQAAKALVSVDQIVKLRIQKNECYADEPDPRSLITFNVELPRFAGPLGIFLTSAASYPGSVVIANLTADGLADKTGALRVGDQILAINGVRLHGKNIEEAVRLLPISDEGINIKIMRRLSSPGQRKDDTGSSSHAPSNRIISLDSVLELWDGWGHDYNITRAITHRGTARDLKLNGRAHSSSGSAEVFCDLDQGRVKRPPVFPCSTSSYKNDTPPLNQLPQSPKYRPVATSAELVSETCSCQTKTYDSIELPSTIDATGNARPDSSTTVEADGRRAGAVCSTAALPCVELDYVVPSSARSAAEYTDSTVFDVSRFDTLRYTPAPEELIQTTLYRVVESVSFGFSLSNGIDEPGVFVGAVKEDGPAADKLQPYDRIVQINGVVVSDMSCSDVVPMIAQTGIRLDLVISRRQVSAEAIVPGPYPIIDVLGVQLTNRRRHSDNDLQFFQSSSSLEDRYWTLGGRSLAAPSAFFTSAGYDNLPSRDQSVSNSACATAAADVPLQTGGGGGVFSTLAEIKEDSV